MAPKALLTAALITLSSTLPVFAACNGHSEQVMTCAEGSEYDPTTGTCKVVTG